MHALIHWRERLFATWATPCPLCEMSSRGGLLCVGCEEDWYAQRQRRALCLRCAGERTLANTRYTCDTCHTCHSQPPPHAFACAALDYGFPVRLMMTDFKQGGRLAIARPLAHLMFKASQNVIEAPRPDAYVPVPASVQRLQRHGFSPPQQLAWHLGRFSGIAVRTQWLQWLRPTPLQKTLSRAERQVALSHALRASPAVSGQWIGVVDDVMTTGSTLSEAARALLAAGARGVTVIAAMRASERPNLAQSRPCLM